MINNNKNEPELQINLDADKEQIYINADKNGLLLLKSMIDSLIEKDGCDHVHLMTEKWGGPGLTSNEIVPNTSIINHLKISIWKK
jgi:hypothetical protein